MAISGRLANLKLKQADGWQPVLVGVLSAAEALDQLHQELGADRSRFADADLAGLAERLGFLPLALHLAAGHLRAGRSLKGLLEKLESARLAMISAVPGEDDTRSLLHTTFQLSLSLLTEQLGSDADTFLPGLYALGHAPATGVGASLGAALCGLASSDYEDLCCAAISLSLLDADDSERVRLHPLLAEWLRRPADQQIVLDRMTEWFCQRLPALPAGSEAEQGRHWREIHDESEALSHWLARVPDAIAFAVEQIGRKYAIHCGPFAVWQQYCERLMRVVQPSSVECSNILWTLANVAQSAGDIKGALEYARKKVEVDRLRDDDRSCAFANGLIADILFARGDRDEALRNLAETLPVYERLGDVRSKAVTQGRIADILFARGDLDEALRNFAETLPVYERLGDVSSKAVTQGKIADILFARGDLDAALRIRQHDELPVYERLGDVHSKAVTQGKIADILFARGDLDEALRIRQHDELPVYERLGDVREKAVTQGKIADILFARGDLDAALRIREHDELPVYERLGDVRAKAVTQGKIADILFARGDLDGALRIREHDELPVYERLGDVREKAVTQGKIADILFARGDLDAALRIREHDQLPVYERLGDVREKAATQGRIADILFARGDLDEALRIREHDELPVYERLGEVRAKAVTQGKIADILFARGDLDAALRIREHDELPVYERLGDVRSKAVTQGQIADILFARGDLDAALALHAERLPVAQALGELVSIAHIRLSMAQIRLARGDLQSGSAQTIYEELAEAFAISVRLGRPDAIGASGFLLAQVLAVAGHRDEARSVLDQAEAGFTKIGDTAGLDAIRQVREWLDAAAAG